MHRHTQTPPFMFVWLWVLAKHMPSVEFAFIGNTIRIDKAQIHNKRDYVWTIAINLINIFFLFVPNTSTSSVQRIGTHETTKLKMSHMLMHRARERKPTYVRLIYWVFISNKYRHLAHKSTQPFITIFM